MSFCNTCGCNPCNCSPSLCAPVDCPDPGVIPEGNHLPVLDYKLCERRLENTRGFLVCDYAAGGTPKVFFTEEPCIEIPILEINVGDEITSFVGALGDAACQRRLVPAADADGWLRAIGGKWVLSELPSENLPEPFEVENLIVNETATITDLVVAATLCFDALPSDTVTETVGLNAGGCLVKGTTSQIQAALFYESASLTSAGMPNDPIASNTMAIIGNEIFDPQNIASIVSTTRLKIDKAGSYFIIWSGFYDRSPETDNSDVGVDLVINSSPVARSCGRTEHLNAPNSANPIGFQLMDLAVNDTIELKAVSNLVAPVNHLRDVKIILINYRPT